MKGSFKAKVISKRFLSDDVFLLKLREPIIAEESLPGQFVNLRCSSIYEPLLRRPLSIYDVEEDNFLLLIRIIGKGTKLLSTVREGDELDVLGPLGNPFPYGMYQNPLLVAGGIGIAPLHFLLRRLSSPILLFGARSKSELYGLEDLTKIARVIPFTEDGSEGERGLVTTRLKEFLKGHDVIFACGPMGMLREVVTIAKSVGVPSYISLEERMACGFGACLGCAVKTKKGYKMVCKDGPVMPGEEVII